MRLKEAKVASVAIAPRDEEETEEGAEEPAEGENVADEAPSEE